MSDCWWCCWGWPKQIRDIYDDAVKQLGDCDYALHWGPAHVVWEDENWDCAAWCLRECDDPKWLPEFSERELAVVRESLRRLLAVPEEFKNEPAGYVESIESLNHPERYPPPGHWEMVKK